MKTIKSVNEFKEFTFYFDVTIVKAGDGFCIVKLIGKKK